MILFFLKYIQKCKNGNINCWPNMFVNCMLLSKLFKTATIGSAVTHSIKHTMETTYLQQYFKTSYRCEIKLYFQFNHENIG